MWLELYGGERVPEPPDGGSEYIIDYGTYGHVALTCL